MVAAFTQKTLGGETAGRYEVDIQTEPTAEREGPRGGIKYPNARKKRVHFRIPSLKAPPIPKG